MYMWYTWKGLDTDLIIFSQIVQLVEDSYPSPRPCLKLKLTSTTSSADKKVQILKITVHAPCAIHWFVEYCFRFLSIISTYSVYA